MAAIFTLPKSQTLRFVNKNLLTSQQTYDNRFAERLRYPITSPYHFTQKILNSDSLWIQFRTNYSEFKAYIYDSSNTKIDITSNANLIYTDSSGRNYYNLEVSTSALSGCYFIEFIGSDVDKSTFVIQSEIFEVVDYMPDSVLIEWIGNDYAYDDQMHWGSKKQFIRVIGRDRELQVEQSKSVYNNSDYAPVTLKSKPIRNVKIEFELLPYWMVEKINLALNHDYFYCNGVQYNTEDLIEAEAKGNSQLYTASIIATQINFENGEDDEITGGEILQSYLKTNDTDYLLINDSGDRLKINN